MSRCQRKMRWVEPLLAAVVLANSAIADDVTIVPAENCSARFEGEEVTLRYRVSATADSVQRAGVALTVQGKTIARRDVEVRIGPSGSGEIEVPVQLSATSPGVVLAATTAITVGSGPPFEHAWSIFPDDPLVGRRTRFKQLQLAIYDPREDTVRRFRESSIPHRTLHRMEELRGLKQGTLVIGEGISLGDHRGLADSMIAAAKRGVSVLCLAPSAGELPLPGLGSRRGNDSRQEDSPAALTFRRNDIITEFDKRFDADSWCGDGGVIASTVATRIQRHQRFGEIRAGDAGWPWVAIDFQPPGRLVFCGFAIIDQWENNPTPRYFLAAVLESLSLPTVPTSADPSSIER